MRVLTVTRPFRSGQTTHVLELVAGLRRHGVRADLTAMPAPDERTAAACGEAAAALGLRWDVCADEDALTERIRCGGHHLVHAHSSHSWPMAARAAATTGRPLVLTAHGSGLVRRWLLPALARASAVIAVGERFAAEIAPHARRVFVVPNGVDLDRFRPREPLDPHRPPDGPLRVAWFGREEASRAPVRSFALTVAALNEQGRGIEAVLIGASIPFAGVPTLGWVADPAPALAGLHVVAGCGRSLREAMACGAVGLLTGARYGGIVWPARLSPGRVPDLGGRAGPGLQPLSADAFARDLVRLDRDRRLLAWLRYASRRVAERCFALDDMVRRTIEVYARCLS